MTVIANAGLVLKDSHGNKGIVKSLTDNDIDKISSAITDVGQVVDPATHMPIEATKTSAGVVQLATAQDITNGTAGKVVDAQELNNFAQTLPAANGVTDVSSGDNSNQLVVSRIGGSKTLTIDNVEHAGTATSADSVAWDKVSGKPTAVSSFTNDSGYITSSGTAATISQKVYADATTSTNYGTNGAYVPTMDFLSYWNGAYNSGGNSNLTYCAQGTIIGSSNIGSQSVNYANSAGNADTLDGYHHDSFPKVNSALFTVNGLSAPGWSKIGTGDGGSCIQVKTTDNTYPSICFHRSGYSHCVLAESNGQLGTMQEGSTTFNHLITSANIGSQSVNYANSAGSAENSSYTYWLRTSSHADHLVHTEWDGGYFWTYVAAPDGGYRAVRVERANSSGWADSAGSCNYATTAGNGVDSAGGTWIRFKNGIQMMIITGVTSNEWHNFSVPFAIRDTMSIVASPVDNSTNSLTAKIHEYTTTSFFVRVYNNDNNNAQYATVCTIFAMGFWK